jgi:hypothetical protein
MLTCLRLTWEIRALSRETFPPDHDQNVSFGANSNEAVGAAKSPPVLSTHPLRMRAAEISRALVRVDFLSPVPFSRDFVRLLVTNTLLVKLRRLFWVQS